MLPLIVSLEEDLVRESRNKESGEETQPNAWVRELGIYVTQAGDSEIFSMVPFLVSAEISCEDNTGFNPLGLYGPRFEKSP